MAIDFQEYKPVQRNFKPRDLQKYKDNLPALTDIQKEVLVGTLLGDSTMNTFSTDKGGAQNQFKFAQKSSSLEYVQQMYMMFQPFVGTPPKYTFPSGGSSSKEGSYSFKTYRVPCFRYFAAIFYKSSAPFDKKVPKNIAKLLTARSLAYWYMDDGSRSKTRNNVYLHCQSFTREDQEVLRTALKKNFDLDWTIQKDTKSTRLYLKVHSHEKFFELVRPYIYCCFMYKLPPHTPKAPQRGTSVTNP